MTGATLVLQELVDRCARATTRFRAVCVGQELVEVYSTHSDSPTALVRLDRGVLILEFGSRLPAQSRLGEQGTPWVSQRRLRYSLADPEYQRYLLLQLLDTL